MSIYNKPVSQLEPDDLQALLDDRPVENVRLEFKREMPGKQQVLKKCCAFANTYGGRMVIGAEEDGAGRLGALPGVEEERGFGQRMVDLCQAHIYPPVVPIVSGPIAAPGSEGAVCYVVHIEESEAAPHFINGRKGCYVRTGEFGNRFNAELATYEDIAHLADRRRIAVERRQSLLERARRRFAAMADAEFEGYASTHGGNRKELGATLEMAVLPRFPTAPLVDQTALRDIVRETARWGHRGFRFPSSAEHDSHVVHQHESLLLTEPFPGSFSLSELTTWGSVHVVVELQDVAPRVGGPDEEPPEIMWMGRLALSIVAIIEHSGRVLERLGYEGSVVVNIRLQRVRGIPLVGPSRRLFRYDDHRGSRYDDEVEFAVGCDPMALSNGRPAVCDSALETALYALGWEYPEIRRREVLGQAFKELHLEPPVWEENEPAGEP